MIRKLLNSKKSAYYLGISLLLWVLIGFILYPALKTFYMSFNSSAGLSLVNYFEIFTSRVSMMALRNTVMLGVLTVLVCGTLGTVLAFLVNYFELKYKKIIDKLLLLPLVLPGLIIVFSFVQLYGESGLVTKTLEAIFSLNEAPYSFSGLRGILFVHAYTQYVYFYLNVSVGIKQLDQSTIDASRNLGASKLKVFTSIILPTITPALIASSIITFMTGIGSFSAPSIIGGSYKVLTTQILLSKANNFMSIAATQVVILILVSVTYLVLARGYERRKRFTPSVRATPIRPVRIKSNGLNILVHILLVLLLTLIILPIITIIVLSFVKPGTWMIDIYPREFSFENYAQIFYKTRALKPFLNSITMSTITAFFCLAIAIPASYIIVKTKSKVRALLEFLTMLPLAMPSSAIAINMINAFNKPNLFALNTVLVGLYILLPLAYFVSALPLMVRASIVSLQSLNDTYLEASKILGARRLQTFFTVVIPTIAPGITAGLLLIFIRSIGEYTISVFMYNASNQPISIAMANSIFEYDIGLAMAYGSLIVIIAVVISTIIRRLSSDK